MVHGSLEINGVDIRGEGTATRREIWAQVVSGSVRTVEPELVFESAFEGVNQSKRHKSGFAMRFPCISGWRIDKPTNQADIFETVRSLLTIDS